jgi:hypothetical protein
MTRGRSSSPYSPQLISHLLTKKAFRRYLNERHPSQVVAGLKQGSMPGPRTRGYGDYLYSQDKEMFDVEYEAWVDKHRRENPIPPRGGY